MYFFLNSSFASINGEAQVIEEADRPQESFSYDNESAPEEVLSSMENVVDGSNPENHDPINEDTNYQYMDGHVD